MNKAELINAAAEKAGLSKKDTETAINAAIEVSPFLIIDTRNTPINVPIRPPCPPFKLVPPITAAATHSICSRSAVPDLAAPMRDMSIMDATAADMAAIT